MYSEFLTLTKTKSDDSVSSQFSLNNPPSLITSNNLDGFLASVLVLVVDKPIPVLGAATPAGRSKASPFNTIKPVSGRNNP